MKFVSISEDLEKYGFVECLSFPPFPEKECWAFQGKYTKREDGSVICSKCNAIIGTDIDDTEELPPSIEDSSGDDDDDSQEIGDIKDGREVPLYRQTLEQRLKNEYNTTLNSIMSAWKKDRDLESLVYEYNRYRDLGRTLYVRLNKESFFVKGSMISFRVLAIIYHILITYEKVAIPQKSTQVATGRTRHRKIIMIAKDIPNHLEGASSFIQNLISSYGSRAGFDDRLVSEAVFLWNNSQPPYISRSDEAKALGWLLAFYRLKTGENVVISYYSKSFSIDRKALSATFSAYLEYLKTILN